MPDRISSDHPDVVTGRARVARHGPRRRLTLPENALDAIGDRPIIETVVVGRTRFSRVRTVDGIPSIVGLYRTKRAADAGELAADRLSTRLDDWTLDIGDSAMIDVLEAGRRIGLRPPGARVVYQARRPPDDSLVSIARRFTLEE